MPKRTATQLFRSLSLRFTGAIVLVEVVIASITGTIYATNFTNELSRRAIQTAQVPINLANDGVLEYSTFANRTEMESIVGQALINAFVVGANDNIFFSIEGDFLGSSFQDYATAAGLPDFDLLSLTETISLTNAQGNSVVVAPLVSEDRRTVRFYAFLEISNASLIEQRNALIQLFVLGGVATVVITSLIIYFLFDRTVFSRIRTTLNVLEQVASGNLNARLPQPTADEIGGLQNGVNNMATQLQGLVNGLETRVTERTRDLTVSGEIAQQIAAFLNLSELLSELVELTALSFDFYQVNIYLLNTETQRLELKAASGQVGESMIATHRAFSIDGQGLVPSVMRDRQPIVSNDISQEPRHLPNPLLPFTRSEATLPIVFGETVLGVLNLQATQLNRFSKQEVELFTAFANQIAVALRNASLFEETKVALQRAEAADSAKSAFLASTSHELRTPLNAIINLTSFVRRGMMGEVTPRQEEILSLVVQSGQNLLALINDVLDMSKIESGSLKLYIEPDINITPIIEHVIATTRGLLQDKSVVFNSEIATDLPLMAIDKHRFQQILLNILSNACKFTEHGEITLAVRAAHDQLHITVRDTGVGIAADDLDKVFVKFTQTESGLRQGGGTGLGMPITKSLVEAHQGQIWLESEMAVGTTFFVTLPLTQLAELSEISLKMEA